MREDVIHTVDGSLCTDRRPMGEDGTALSGQADGPRAQWQEQPLVFRSGALDCANGSPWCDLPVLFGNWSTAFRRFRDWREADVFKRIFDASNGMKEIMQTISAEVISATRVSSSFKSLRVYVIRKE